MNPSISSPVTHRGKPPLPGKHLTFLAPLTCPLHVVLRGNRWQGVILDMSFSSPPFYIPAVTYSPTISPILKVVHCALCVCVFLWAPGIGDCATPRTLQRRPRWLSTTVADSEFLSRVQPLKNHKSTRRCPKRACGFFPPLKCSKVPPVELPWLE